MHFDPVMQCCAWTEEVIYKLRVQTFVCTDILSRHIGMR